MVSVWKGARVFSENSDYVSRRCANLPSVRTLPVRRQARKPEDWQTNGDTGNFMGQLNVPSTWITIA